MAEPVLDLRGVIHEYGTRIRTRVLHGVDLQIEPGEFTAVIGPSGSGKSTLLNLMGLLERPTGGSIRLDGVETAGLDEDRRATLRGRSIGFVFQFHHLLGAFTARENVYMPMFVDRDRVDVEMVARADELLGLVGLADKAGRKATDLSGGQQQRVAIARALAPRPQVVLADEPTGNLDTETADEVFELFRRINREQGTAILVVTHDPRLADRCDRIVRVVDGRLASDRRGSSQGPCRACGYGPCLRDACMLSADIPRDPKKELST